jgi:hypothetical protein
MSNRLSIPASERPSRASRTRADLRVGEPVAGELGDLPSCAVSGLARSDDAFAAAEQATADPDELWFSTFALVELIEAASGSGRTEQPRRPSRC